MNKCIIIFFAVAIILQPKWCNGEERPSWTTDEVWQDTDNWYAVGVASSVKSEAVAREKAFKSAIDKLTETIYGFHVIVEKRLADTTTGLRASDNVYIFSDDITYKRFISIKAHAERENNGFIVWLLVKFPKKEIEPLNKGLKASPISPEYSSIPHELKRIALSDDAIKKIERGGDKAQILFVRFREFIDSLYALNVESSEILERPKNKKDSYRDVTVKVTVDFDYYYERLMDFINYLESLGCVSTNLADKKGYSLDCSEVKHKRLLTDLVEQQVVMITLVNFDRGYSYISSPRRYGSAEDVDSESYNRHVPIRVVNKELGQLIIDMLDRQKGMFYFKGPYLLFERAKILARMGIFIR